MTEPEIWHRTMTRAQFLELAAEFGLMTTNYGGGLITAGDGQFLVMTWAAESPTGDPLPEPEVVIFDPVLESAARQILDRYIAKPGAPE